MNLYLEAVALDGERFTGGEVEVLLSSLGLSQYVYFYLVNEEGDYFTVIWDPVLAVTDVVQGYEEAF